MEKDDEDGYVSEIAMVPLVSAVGYVIRVERLCSKTKFPEDRSIQHVGAGQYQGFIIKKAARVRPYRGSPDAVRRFTAYVCNHGSTIKETREIRFWFKEQIADDLSWIASEFFKELIHPKNFPKDHLAYVKRVLQLVRSYQQLRFVEVEIRPYEAGDRHVDVQGQRAEKKSKLKKMTSFIDVRSDSGHVAGELRPEFRNSLGRRSRHRNSTAEVPTLFIDLDQKVSSSIQNSDDISSTNSFPANKPTRNRNRSSCNGGTPANGEFIFKNINEDLFPRNEPIPNTNKPSSNGLPTNVQFQYKNIGENSSSSRMHVKRTKNSKSRFASASTVPADEEAEEVNKPYKNLFLKKKSVSVGNGDAGRWNGVEDNVFEEMELDLCSNQYNNSTEISKKKKVPTATLR